MPQMTNEREYRDFTLEIKAPDTEEEKTMVVEGYASTFNEPYELYSDSEVRILEQVDPKAFVIVSDVREVLGEGFFNNSVYDL